MTPALYDFFYSLLKSAEHKRLERLIASEKQTQFLISKALTRLLLAQYLQVPPQTIEFETDLTGKPSIAKQSLKNDIEPIEFNLSHTAGCLAWAFAHKIPVGIDVERLDPTKNVLKIAHFLFNDQELEELYRVQETPALITTFFRIWTQREAYIKATGRLLLSKIRPQDYVTHLSWLLLINHTHVISLATPSQTQGAPLPQITLKHCSFLDSMLHHVV